MKQVGLITLALTAFAAADTFTVLNWSPSGAGSLRQAVFDAEANPGPDTINFIGTTTGFPGMAGKTININNDFPTITEDLTIDATALLEPVTIAPNDTFYTENSSRPTLDVEAGVQLTLRAINFFRCGGGAIGNAGLLTVERCIFSRCFTGESGGAIRNDEGATLVISSSGFYRNIANRSGGAIQNRGTMSITGSFLIDNYTQDSWGYGGGIGHSSSGDLDIYNCSFLRNSGANYGDDLYAGGDGSSTINLVNTTFGNIDNSGNGGVRLSNFATAAIRSTTFAMPVRVATGNATFSNCIIDGALRTTNLAPANITSGGGNVIGSVADELGTLFPSGFPNANGDYVGTSSSPFPAKLEPWGDYGGPLPTMPPRPESAAVDGGNDAAIGPDEADLDDDGNTAEDLPVDQRGSPRQVGVSIDAGAVEFRPSFVVSNTNPTGPGSLDQAVADAESAVGPDTIVFDAALSGQTINRNSANGPLSITTRLTIDGSALAVPPSISGDTDGDLSMVDDRERLFIVSPGAELILDSLVIRDGRTFGSIDDGGAMLNQGTTLVRFCSFLLNHSGDSGGAIQNSGTLTIVGSTFEDNDCDDDGGAISNSLTLDIWDSTFHSNHAVSTGGAIRTFSGTKSTITNCTFYEDTGASGRSLFLSGGTMSLRNSTIVGTTGSAGIRIVGGSLTMTNTLVTMVDPGNLLVPFSTSISLDPSANLITEGGNFITNHTSVESQFPVSNINRDLVGEAMDPLIPALLPFGDYGGPTWTIPPATSGGRSIIGQGVSTSLPPDSEDLDDDLDTAESLPVDQRGYPRDFGGSIDIGAVERFSSATVTNNRDTGPGTLRFLTAGIAEGGTIDFDPSLAGESIRLASAPLLINRDVIVDASPLVGGITLSGDQSHRVLTVNAEADVTIDSVHITDGANDNGAGLAVDGGATVLRLRNSHIHGNRAEFSSADGGGITVGGTLIAENCLVEDNIADDGGGGLRIYTTGEVTLENCTFHDNHARTGGGIHATNNLTARFCTITGNSSSDDGGGLRMSSSPNVTLDNCIIATNTAGGTGADIRASNGVLTPVGNNLVGNNQSVDSLFSVGSLVGSNSFPLDPELLPLGNYGGPTPSMLPRDGSPALNAANFDAATIPTTDQRGSARLVGPFPDLGAVESETFTLVLAETPASGGSISLLGAPGAGPISEGTSLTLTPLPAPGFLFSHWSGDLPSGSELDDPLLVTMDRDRSLTAHFTVAVNLTVLFDPARGLVTPVPANPYPKNTVVKLTATPLPGFVFAGWSNGLGLDPELSLTLDGDSTITANFVAAVPGLVRHVGNVGPGSLRDSILSASPGDTITFAPQLDGMTITLPPDSGSLELDKELSIDASALPGGLILSGGGFNQVFLVLTPDPVTLTGLTIRDGWTPSPFSPFNSGGAIGTSTIVDLAIDGCSFLDNFAIFGGGAIASGDGGTVEISNSFFSGNEARSGGAVWIDLSNARIENSLFENNRANVGGALFNAGSTTIDQCTFRINEAFSIGDPTTGTYYSPGDGGAIANEGDLLIGRTTIHGNAADNGGGGIHNEQGGELTLLNTTIAQNGTSDPSAPVSRGGGGIRNSGTLMVWNSTIALNVSKNFGAGGIQAVGSVYMVNMKNSIVADNDGIFYEDLNFTDTDPCNIIGNPDALSPAGLTDNGGPTLTILPADTALDTGDPAELPADLLDFDDDGVILEFIPVDQRGLPRSWGSQLDIGAVECQPLHFAFLFSALDPSGTGDANGNGLSDYFEYAAGFDPTAPGLPALGPFYDISSGTYSHPIRTGVADAFASYEFSTSLRPAGELGGWEDLLPGTHYTLDSSDPNLLKLDLLPSFHSGQPVLFLRHRFSPSPGSP